MPRIARIIIPGVAHHITQRGNNRQTIFFVDDDQGVYLKLLKKQAETYGLRLLGYCLMSNHIHLLATPAETDSLAKAVGRTHFLYSQYINRLHGRSGHLWQGRFYSSVLDANHCWAALRYIENNPVRAGLLRTAWNYPWSSATAHIRNIDPSGLLDMKGWRVSWDEVEWKKWLGEKEEKETAQKIKARLYTGRPLGSDVFISKLEHALGRRLRALPVGRPKRAQK